MILYKSQFIWDFFIYKVCKTSFLIQFMGKKKIKIIFRRLIQKNTNE